MSAKGVPPGAAVDARVCDIFRVWIGRETDHLTVNQVAAATGLRPSQLLGTLDAMVAGGVLEATPAATGLRRYRVNARPNPQQLEQKRQIMQAIEASKSAQRDFAY